MIELSAVVQAATTAVAGRIAEQVFESRLRLGKVDRSNRYEVASDQKSVERLLRVHLTEVSNWAAQLQVWGMPRPVSVPEMTTGLRISDIPRKFRSGELLAESQADVLGEADLLDGVDHYVLLGDPGAGKTTTVKRLINRLLREPQSARDTWNLPLLVLLREHVNSTSISRTVIDKLGLRGLYLKFVESSTGPADVADTRVDLSESVFLAEFLNDCGAVLFLDGLDEVNPEVRLSLEDGIQLLSRKLTSAKIVVSCRSGDYTRVMEGLVIAELLPLSRDQITEIAARWIPERTEQFLEEIGSGPAADLADRPLFLFQMLALARRMEAIPDQPSSICRQMVRLMLQDWDHQRGMSRRSRYANAFDVDAKLSFLTALAYFGTFQLRKRRFEHRDFIRAYERLHARFGLPSDEADEVATEIETHTGLVVEAGYKRFEFSHLSIQEYLAAEYVVRLPNSDEYRRLLERSPATVAVAVALSSDPDVFLSALTTSLPDHDLIEGFVSRLRQERPRFAGGDHLGSAVLRILTAVPTDALDSVAGLMDYPEVAPSVRSFVNWAELRRPRGKWSLMRIPLDDRRCRRWGVPLGSVLVDPRIAQHLTQT